MAEFLSEYGLFLIKTLTLVVAILFVVGGVVALTSKQRSGGGQRGQLAIRKINDAIEEMQATLQDAILSKAELKKLQKQKKQDSKKKDKSKDKEPETRKRLFVLEFDGDVRASEVELLREEISAILTVASEQDEVLLRLESPGGMVHGYGLAAAQLQRLREHKLTLTVSVDKVAASGGYLMACVAQHIVAAPFAIIGSIGVIGQVPNIHRLLKRIDVDVEQHTAGEFKRTLTLLGENTDKAREKFVEELEQTHDLFKAFVAQYRPSLDLSQVATGEHWYGQQALPLGLIDSLQTSDEFLLARVKDCDVYTVSYEQKLSLMDKLSELSARAVEGVVWRGADYINKARVINK